MAVYDLNLISLDYNKVIKSDAMEIKNLISTSDISSKFSYTPDLSSQAMLSLILCAAHSRYLFFTGLNTKDCMKIGYKLLDDIHSTLTKGQYKNNFTGLESLYTEIYVSVNSAIDEEKNPSKPEYLHLAYYTLYSLFSLPNGKDIILAYSGLLRAIAQAYQRILPTVLIRMT